MKDSKLGKWILVCILLILLIVMIPFSVVITINKCQYGGS